MAVTTDIRHKSPQIAHDMNASPLPTPALVLIVDDEVRNVKLLETLLHADGHDTISASNGKEALLLAVSDKPDLILLDIMMPFMDGWEFLERFKQQERFASVPVVIVSIVTDKSRGMSLGASQVLQKPVSREEFSRSLAAIGFSVGPQTDQEQRTVLVVDDDPKAVQLLGAYLTPAGYRVLSAFGGQEGIDVARQQRPNLILLDLMMPEVNGFDVVDALKVDVNTATIPIVIVTAKQITAEDRALLEGAVLKVIQKSQFKQAGFIEEVKRAMRGKGG
jgi:CheY-like chemotaxis protein